MKTYIGFLVFLSGVLLSCSKEEAPDKKTYYGKVSITQVSLPGTPLMEWWFNGQKIGNLTGNEPMLVPATPNGKLEIFLTDTHELIADTTISIARNEKRNFKFAWSIDYGIKGWISSEAVAGDSLSMQVLNNLSVANYPVSAPDLYIITLDPATLEVLDTIAVIPHFERGKLSPVRLTLPVYDANGNLIQYAGKLKDPATGEYILNTGLGLDLFGFFTDDFSIGTVGVYIVADDVNAFIAGNAITL